MSTISSNPLLDFYPSNYAYSAANKKQSNTEQATFGVNANNQNYSNGKNTNAAAKGNEPNLFEQGLLEAAKKADTATSAPVQGEATPEARRDKTEIYQDAFMEGLAKHDNDIVAAMVHARAETFDAMFKEELERSGSVKSAIAYASSQVEMSNAELSNVLADLAKEYEGMDDIQTALEDAVTELNDKMSLRDYAEREKDSDSDKTDNNNELMDPLALFASQSKESIARTNNKQAANLYETMLAENAPGGNINGNNRGKSLSVTV